MNQRKSSASPTIGCRLQCIAMLVIETEWLSPVKVSVASIHRRVHFFKLLWPFDHYTVAIFVIKNNNFPIVIRSANQSFPLSVSFPTFLKLRLYSFGKLFSVRYASNTNWFRILKFKKTMSTYRNITVKFAPFKFASELSSHNIMKNLDSTFSAIYWYL